MTNNEIIDHIAATCHEANRALCESQGDDSQRPWAEAPEWQRASVRDGVRFALNNPTISPAESHANWLQHKAQDGWTWGPVKDPANKMHPCMVPYEELPASQRVKDALFTAIVRGFRALLLAQGAERGGW